MRPAPSARAEKKRWKVRMRGGDVQSAATSGVKTVLKRQILSEGRNDLPISWCVYLLLFSLGISLGTQKWKVSNHFHAS